MNQQLYTKTMLKVKHLLPVSLFICATSIAAAQQNPTIKDAPAANDTILISRTVKGVAITGRITDAVTKKAAPGIRVQVENFSAAITDDNGHFSLSVPSYNSTVQISGEGYDQRFVPLQGKKEITVALLDESHESIQETINTPTGIHIKRNLTASVGTHNVNGMALPTETADALLQGCIAGLNVIRRSGLQGAGANLFMRGYNSLYATNKPLIVVDNLLYDANEYGQSIIANNYTNPFYLIDLKDIDNITVLRDA